jgi:hypothetical protein
MSDKWVVENKWRCATCQTENAGGAMRCATCGKGKEALEQYDASGAVGAAAITDANKIAAAYAGQHWACAYCGFQMRALRDHCESCGAARAAAPAQGQAVGAVGPSGPVGVPIASGLPPGVKVSNVAPPKKSSPIFMIGCIGLVLVVAIGGAVLFWPSDTTARVDSRAWSMVTHREERTVRNGTGWREAMPAGARVSSCEQRQVGTMQCNPRPCVVPANGQCNPHECNCENQCRDLGTGFSECQRVCQTCYDTCTVGAQSTCFDQCPRMGEFCTFQYDEWRSVEQATARGTDGNPAPRALTATGEQRIRHESVFTVVFTDADGERHEYHPENVEEYRRFEPGQSWTAETSLAGGFRPISQQ